MDGSTASCGLGSSYIGLRLSCNLHKFSDLELMASKIDRHTFLDGSIMSGGASAWTDGLDVKIVPTDIAANAGRAARWICC